jgi:hypothetical protein
MKGYEYEIKAIPTVFQGVQMRSRLEARWAAFFTECGWEWTYEPFDFEGWSPDFLLKLHRPVFVEVKPKITQALMAELLTVSEKLRAEGARVLLVGDSIRYHYGDGAETVAGIGVGAGEGSFDNGFDDISVGYCGGGCRGNPVGMAPSFAAYHCWVCNGYDGNPVRDYHGARIQERWAKACNGTQWHPR